MRTATRTAVREARRRPAADWWNAGDRSHAVQFYSDDAVLVELLSRFVGTALVMGDAAVVLATKRHRDAVSIRLRRRGLDIGIAREQGRYVVADAAQLLEKIASKGRVSTEAFHLVIGRLLDRAARAAGGIRVSSGCLRRDRRAGVGLRVSRGGAANRRALEPTRLRP